MKPQEVYAYYPPAIRHREQLNQCIGNYQSHLKVELRNIWRSFQCIDFSSDNVAATREQPVPGDEARVGQVRRPVEKLLQRFLEAEQRVAGWT